MNVPTAKDSAPIADQAIDLAARLLQRAGELQTPQERRQQAELDRMINHSGDKSTLVEMTDQAFRTHTPARVADQLTHLLDIQGVPRFFNPVEQAMLRGFQSFGEYLPGVAVPLVKEKMRRETANVILPAESELLTEHLRNRQQQGVRMNLNLLGEAILGEAEARRRIQQCIDALRLPDVRCLSVKISTLYSQTSVIARKHTVSKVSDRLETLYRTADKEIDPASGTGKFVYLDMEEYRDLYLTADILRETLDRPGLDQTRAGIALQAYIPDSFQVMQQLCHWSAKRVAHGGHPLTIRLVKGANMEMERVEASIGGHPQAPYSTKLETDANYKRMLRELIEFAAEGQVRIGLASHNVFDIALGMIWAENKVPPHAMQIEMLEGMANHQRRAISEQYDDLLLYAPACRQDGFLNAISYLVRRLDENTGPQNFLRHAYRLRRDSKEFETLARDFQQSLQIIDTVDTQPRRRQDRHQPPLQPDVASDWRAYVNEPDTDWSVPANATWAESIVERWQSRCGQAATERSLRIGSREIPVAESQWRQSTDPSRPESIVYRYQAATVSQVREAVQIAADDHADWASRPMSQRHDILRSVAQTLRERRGDLIGAMLAEGGKVMLESDPEVSEAIDFCEFYALSAVHWDKLGSLRNRPRGVVAVVTPWNFPLAIPCGGIASSLMAGNRVILKPASETPLVATLLCEAFWDAGVPREALQYLPCDDAIAEEGLVRNGQVDTVILTGGTTTAKRMLKVRPGLHLLAETGGKNATIVTAMADRDQAVKHVIHSAFGHAGQKCSATSLLLLEQEVFDDPQFKSMLADAVESLPVGSAWDPANRMGPLISPPNAELARGLKTLEDDEEWLVVPEHIVGNPNLYRPGVKWNIRPGGFAHLTELFGPVLSVMPFSRLEEAIQIVRATGYGLTSGLESLDDREIDLWKQTIHAGNLYINRSTTGAIVLRQPFGGVGMSAYGPGVKAGGPHYVLPLMHLEDAPHTDVDQTSVEQTIASRESTPDRFHQLSDWLDRADQESWLDKQAIADQRMRWNRCLMAYHDEFADEHDTVRLIGQDNLRRYRPVSGLTIRVDSSDPWIDAIGAVIAAVAVGTQLVLSIDPKIKSEPKEILESIADDLPGHVHPIEETEQELAERINRGDVTRLRKLAAIDPKSPVAAVCGETFTTIVDRPVLREGRIECLWYLNEQSISHDYHRYGNLGRRAEEVRRELIEP